MKIWSHTMYTKDKRESFQMYTAVYLVLFPGKFHQNHKI